jgi:hypothetical protein
MRFSRLVHEYEVAADLLGTSEAVTVPTAKAKGHKVTDGF